MKISVGLPYNSALIKLDILPRKRPTGAEAQIKSVRVKKVKSLFLEKSITVSIIPKSPP